MPGVGALGDQRQRRVAGALVEVVEPQHRQPGPLGEPGLAGPGRAGEHDHPGGHAAHSRPGRGLARQADCGVQLPGSLITSRLPSSTIGQRFCGSPRAPLASCCQRGGAGGRLLDEVARSRMLARSMIVLPHDSGQVEDGRDLEGDDGVRLGGAPRSMPSRSAVQPRNSVVRSTPQVEDPVGHRRGQGRAGVHRQGEVAQGGVLRGRHGPVVLAGEPAPRSRRAAPASGPCRPRCRSAPCTSLNARE